MKIKYLKYWLYIFLVLPFVNCTKKQKTNSIDFPIFGNNESYRKYLPKPIKYRIRNTDSVVKINQNISIFLPKDLFLNSTNGGICEDYYLEIFDADNLRKKLFTGLTTLSDGKILKSAGMFHLKAYSINGDSLVFNKNKSIELISKVPDSGYEVFSGNNKNGDLNWDTMVKAEKSYINPKFIWFVRDNKFDIEWNYRFYKNVDIWIPNCRYKLEMLNLTEREIDSLIANSKYEKKWVKDYFSLRGKDSSAFIKDGFFMDAKFKIQKLGWINIDKRMTQVIDLNLGLSNNQPKPINSLKSGFTTIQIEGFSNATEVGLNIVNRTGSIILPGKSGVVDYISNPNALVSNKNNIKEEFYFVVKGIEEDKVVLGVVKYVPQQKTVIRKEYTYTKSSIINLELLLK